MSHRAQCLVLNGLQVLLVHYIQGEHDYWGLPGGPLNENEPPERAAQRHLEDACGLRVSKLRLLSRIDYAANDVHCTFEVEGFMGELRLGEGLNLSVDSQLIEAVAWKHVDDLSDLELAFALSSGLLCSRPVRYHLRRKQLSSKAKQDPTTARGMTD